MTDVGAGELESRVALVTGGSRGIGLAIARSLAEGGARIAVVARDEGRARAAAAELPGGGHEAFSCDVAEPERVAEMVAGVQDRLGGVSILINNAGITRDNILLRMKDEDWNEVININLKGAFNLIRSVTRGMMKRRDGAIVNISSVVGLMGNPGQTNYAAAKSGLFGLTKSVARELASRNIRCNAVAPGYITTEMTAALDEDQTAALRERIPLGRLGDPEDVAGVVRFLVGPWARYITGQILAVDGGMVM
jgi:3-oxoacyl-[acyl-carrier protein] reductase